MPIERLNTKLMSTKQHKLINELCDYVEANVLPENFAMESYRDTRTPPDVTIKELASYPNPDKHLCGTSGCMIGYAPVCHPELHKNALDWDEVGEVYCDDATALWEFMFGASWTGFQNTPQGSVERVRLALEFDGVMLPDQWGERAYKANNGASTDELRELLEGAVKE
jgi:hypothetical protein